MPLRHASDTRRSGVFMLFVVIWMGTGTIQCMEEADYFMNLFSTHGSLSKRRHEILHTYKNRAETITKRFCYTEPMDISFLYLYHIDDHNHCSHQKIGLENVQEKIFWEDRVFTFLFSVTEINTYKLHHHFKDFPER